MSGPRKEAVTIHISEIDEYVASRLPGAQSGVVGLVIYGADAEGDVRAEQFEPLTGEIAGEGADFELSPCECAGLDERRVSELIRGPLYTSSAYEFFELALDYYSSLECLVSFTGNTWKIKVLKAVPVV